jgi:hypothetical protein
MASTSQLNALVDRALARARLTAGPAIYRISGGLPGANTIIVVLSKCVIVGGFPRLPGTTTVMPADLFVDPDRP